MTKAQVIDNKNSIRIGVDYMSLEAPDDLGFRYLARYARHLANDRIIIEGSLGYLSTKNRRLALNGFYFEGRPRQRITADLTAYATGIGLQRGTELIVSLILHISVPDFFIRVPL